MKCMLESFIIVIMSPEWKNFLWSCKWRVFSSSINLPIILSIQCLVSEMSENVFYSDTKPENIWSVCLKNYMTDYLIFKIVADYF